MGARVSQKKSRGSRKAATVPVKQILRSAQDDKPKRQKARKPESQPTEPLPETAPSEPFVQESEFELLPRRQQIFITEYLGNGFNATRAGIAAGYSAATADSQASRLLKNDKVARIVKERCSERIAKTELTAMMVIDEIAKVAMIDPREFFTTDGSLIPIRQLGPREAAAIAGMEVTDLYAGQGDERVAIGQLKKIKIASKLKALELLGRHFSVFVDKVEHSGTVGVQLVHDVPRPERKKTKET